MNTNTNDNKKIVEINGIKMEVDLRYAKTIDTYKVGDRVKVLVKEKYGEQYATRYGIILDFNEFQKLPTIVVAYIENSYSACDVIVANINANTKDSCEMVPMNDLEIPTSKEELDVILTRKITEKENELKMLQDKRHYVLEVFEKHFAKAAV